MPPSHDDERWLRRALEVADSARSIARPNPHVGAVVVAAGREVASGATERPGRRHAEVVALDRAGPDGAGATLYVTLEPCAHHGRTPPCTDAILSAGIGRVVVGMVDPNPVAAGGVHRLRAAGLEVRAGVLADRVADQLATWLPGVTARRPHLTLKLAQTRDGATDTSTTGTEWITGPVARRRVHDLRARVDGVLVGSGTVLADDPRLTVRDAPMAGFPPRPVVWDRRGRTPADARVARPGGVVVTGPDAPAPWREALATRDVTVVQAGDLAGGLAALVDLGITTLLAEPGPTLARALLAAGVVDRVLVHVAETMLGDPVPTWAVPMPRHVAVACRRLGADVEWDHRPTPEPAPAAAAA